MEIQTTISSTSVTMYMYNVQLFTWNQGYFIYCESCWMNVEKFRENVCNFPSIFLSFISFHHSSVSPLQFTVWKIEKMSLTKKIFRQINHIVICSVKKLISRNFCQKVKFPNFYTVPYSNTISRINYRPGQANVQFSLCDSVWKFHNFL